MKPEPAAGASGATRAVSPDRATCLDSLRTALTRDHGGAITGELRRPAEPGRRSALPDGLDPRLVRALAARGIERLYAHQEAVWRRVRRGEHTVIVTPTASGKSLAFNLPVLQAAMESRHKALYLFPTKALSQDQVAELGELNRAGSLGVRVHTFDGDTPGDARKAVRTRGDVVVTNPDMLHQGILPHHTKWAQLFENLAYVVIDELHVYRGVFGAHVANVLRRLRRICAFYGRRPVFVLSSATIANPAELASRLVGDEVGAVTENGAPRGASHLLLWNPPVVNEDLGIRASARSQSARIARLAVDRGLKTIVFARTRLMVEVLTKYLKDRFDADPRKSPRVAAYRGGYLPTERRRTERDLRADRIDCVVSTSALELGVDIGGLDVCILNGYPGTVAGTWQRLGRAGRRNRPSLGVLIASSAPLDQYVVRNPDFFFGASPEHARVDPDQLLILLDHVRCAAFELPFRDGEQLGGLPIDDLLDYLEREQVLHHEGDTWYWVADGYPANAVNLRSVADGNFVVVDRTGGEKNVIAEVDYGSAATTLYEGAIYMVQARPWQVETLDWDGRKAFVTATRADYYTEAIDYTRLRVLEEFARDAGARGRAAHGETHVLRRVAGYKKIRYYTHENIGYGEVNLPDQEMHTTAVWWQLSAEALRDAFPSRIEALDGFLGAAHAVHLVAALVTLSEPRDLGRAVGSRDATWYSTRDSDRRGVLRTADGAERAVSDPAVSFRPTMFVYDNYPGGIGLTAALYELRATIVERSHALVAGCECASGCPACVGPILAGERAGGRPPRAAALRVLELLRSTPE